MLLIIIFLILYGVFKFIPNYRLQKILYLIEGIIIIVLIISYGTKLRIHLIFITIEIIIDVITAILLGLLEIGIIIRLFQIRNK